MSEIIYQAIGKMHSSFEHKMESPRQGVLSSDWGEVRLEKKYAGDCLRHLEGCDRIWLIYDFHLNQNWSPVVKPPRGHSVRPGVWATRAPYRPNSIGLSCVKLEKMGQQSLWVSEHDLLDQTPILDIKPYLAYAESFPEAKVAWLNELQVFPVQFSELAEKQVSWLSQQLGLDLKNLVVNQLEYEPLNKKKKRLIMNKSGYQLAYRTWRVNFLLSEKKGVLVSGIDSGYNSSELLDPFDPYQDKSIHNKFLNFFKL